MMGEYVKRSDALQAVGDIHPLDYNGQGIVERIKVIPAADVVEVVRCRDCVEWQSGWKPSGAKEGTHFCAVTGLCKEANWYCADGERKDGGQDE